MKRLERYHSVTVPERLCLARNLSHLRFPTKLYDLTQRNFVWVEPARSSCQNDVLRLSVAIKSLQSLRYLWPNSYRMIVTAGWCLCHGPRTARLALPTPGINKPAWPAVWPRALVWSRSVLVWPPPHFPSRLHVLPLFKNRGSMIIRKQPYMCSTFRFYLAIFKNSSKSNA